ncbi:MAG: hypothetical protein MUE52_04520 [Tabrizicola sp.]|jgi:hypothetical protein|nr:hypothetical protein [Tabrizicola sp.]
MSKIFTIRAGNRRPWLAYDFGFSLVEATGVTFSARDAATGAVFIDNQPAQIADGTYIVNGVQEVLTPADGVAFYAWGPTDTAVERKSALCLFHITWSPGVSESMPSDGYEKIAIVDNF